MGNEAADLDVADGGDLHDFGCGGNGFDVGRKEEGGIRGHGRWQLG